MGENCMRDVRNILRGIKYNRDKSNRPDKINTGHEYEPIHELMKVLFFLFHLLEFRGGGGGPLKILIYKILKKKKNQKN
jgi:hypothetical protein